MTQQISIYANGGGRGLFHSPSITVATEEELVVASKCAGVSTHDKKISMQ